MAYTVQRAKRDGRLCLVLREILRIITIAPNAVHEWKKVKQMRLIDADTLLELYSDRLEKLEERYGVYSGECGVLAGAMKLLEIQPTIEPERKKEGEE